MGTAVGIDLFNAIHNADPMKREKIDIGDKQDTRMTRDPYRSHKHDLSAAKFRSALTNGTTLLTGDVDLRAANARRYRDVVAAHAIDLGGDGQLSEAQKALIRRFAMAQALTELYESFFHLHAIAEHLRNQQPVSPARKSRT